MINRLGNCPNCKCNWDAGDIRERLSRMDVHQFKKPVEIDAIAAQYGWTPENLKRFSATRVHEIAPTPLVGFVFLECTECLHAFDELSGKEYPSIYFAKNNYLDTPEDEFDAGLDRDQKIIINEEKPEY